MSQDREPTDCGQMKVRLITKNALLVADFDNTEYWIPKSQICDESEIDADSGIGDEGDLFLPEWMAVEKGLV